MKLYKIKSKFNALIYLNERFVEVSPSKELCVEAENSLLFNVYPIGSRLAYNVNTQTESQNYRVFELKGFSFVLLEQPLAAENYYMRIVNKVRVVITPQKISFETAEHGSSIPVNSSYTSFKTVEAENFAGVHLSGETETLFLYNPKENLISKFEGDSIKIEGSSITVHTTEKGIAKHAVQAITEISADNLQQTESTLFYKNSKPEIAKSSRLYPIAFLEAIKVKDFSLARMYLAPTLEQKLENEHLERFFIQFDSFEVVDIKNNTQTVLLLNSETHQVCIFEIEKYITNITNE